MLEENKIHLGDCLDLMPSIPSKSVDMILCDLPYGTTACEWDSIIDMSKLWQEYERVIKDNGAIVLTANAKFTILLGASKLKLFRYKYIWIKSKTTMFVQANKMPMRKYEEVLVFYKKLPTYNPQKETAEKTRIKKGGYTLNQNQIFSKKFIRTDTTYDSYYPNDVLYFDNELDKSLIHPTQKPVALFEYLIKTYTNEGDLVLDNCSGSGTTAIACINTNRRYICMEQNKEYYDKAITRLRNHEPLLQMIASTIHERD
jgi:site-specific DNA-methyltransferase (adenine-specific)